MTTLEQTLKNLIPVQAKQAAKGAIRGYGTATATWRPMPDFLVLGTKRGGSTSAWRYLIQHPQVMPMVTRWEHLKSPHYFYWHYDRGLDWYRGHFPSVAARHAAQRRLGRRMITGESSPYYLFDPRVPARVARDLPEARFIVLLRDPVKRAYSHYWERVDNEPIPIGMPVADYEEAEYSAIVYGRGPVFVRELEETMGRETFDAFMRDYLATFRWGNSTTAAFRELAESHCNCDLGPLFEQWVYR